MLRVAHHGPVANVTLNRPERRNALSLELMERLLDTLDEVREDPRTRVVILAADGPVFCAGHDLSEMTGRAHEDYDRLFDTCRRLMLAIHDLPQPVIAMVQGMATAAGCQLVAACDLAVASTAARFATPGVRIGLFCTTPMVEVARAIGRKRALELLLTGDPIDAHTAADWGLVNHVTMPEELDARTETLAIKLADASGLVLCLGKRAYYREIDLPLEAAYHDAQRVMADNALAHDAQEGISAFLAKREPIWRHA